MKDSQPEIDNSGIKWWWNKDRRLYCLHRLDGPAVEYTDGSKLWLIHGKYHRLDGPAREWADGLKCWCINDEQLTQEEFERHPLVIFWRLVKGSTA
jgi:hypothetical protein